MRTSGTKKTRTEPDERDVGDAVLGLRAGRLLAWAEAAGGPAERRWLVEALDEVLARVDPGALVPALLARAESLGADVGPAERVARPPHTVVVPLAGAPLGVARAVLVSYELDAGLAQEHLGEDALRAVREALERAAREAPPQQPVGRFRLGTVQAGALEGLEVDGASLGGAVLASGVSLFSGRPVKDGLAITASLRGARLAPVAGLAAKVEALAVRADVTSLIVPAAQRAEAVRLARGRFRVTGAADVRALLDAALEREALREDDPDLAVTEARRAFGRGWQGWQWPRVRERLERLALALPEGRPDLLVATLTMLGAARRHLGAPEDAWRILSRAAALARARAAELPDAPLAHLEEHLALTALALFELGAARRHATRARSIARRGRLSGEALKASGCVGLVALARGDGRAAVDAQREALALVHRHRPATCVRSHAYLVEALAFAGDLGAARREHAVARRHLARLPDGPPRSDADGWLRTTLGGALVRHGALVEARRVLDVEPVHQRIARDPLPGLAARRHLARALAGTGDAGAAFDLLAASPGAHRDAGPRHVALAYANVLWEARLRAEHDALDADARARAARALDFLPKEGRLESRLAAPAARARRALGEAPSTRVRAALVPLLERLERVGL